MQLATRTVPIYRRILFKYYRFWRGAALVQAEYLNSQLQNLVSRNYGNVSLSVAWSETYFDILNR